MKQWIKGKIAGFQAEIAMRVAKQLEPEFKQICKDLDVLKKQAEKEVVPEPVQRWTTPIISGNTSLSGVQMMDIRLTKQ